MARRVERCVAGASGHQTILFQNVDLCHCLDSDLGVCLNVSSTTVFIVEEDQAVRDSLSLLLKDIGLTILTFSSGAEYLAAYDPEQMGCLILDLHMPDMSGLDVQQRLDDIGPHIPIVFVSARADVSMAVSAMRNGALDLVEKPFRDKTIVNVVQRAIDLDRQHRFQRLEIQRFQGKLNELTPRQREILDLLLTGESTKQIGFRLDVSSKTVDFHRARILRTLESDSLLKVSSLWHRSVLHSADMQLA